MCPKNHSYQLVWNLLLWLSTVWGKGNKVLERLKKGLVTIDVLAGGTWNVNLRSNSNSSAELREFRILFWIYKMPSRKKLAGKTGHFWFAFFFFFSFPFLVFTHEEQIGWTQQTPSYKRVYRRWGVDGEKQSDKFLFLVFRNWRDFLFTS